MAAAVIGDHVVVLGQGTHNARQDPLHVQIGAEAMNQKHRLALALLDVSNLDAGGIEILVRSAYAGDKEQ